MIDINDSRRIQQFLKEKIERISKEPQFYRPEDMFGVSYRCDSDGKAAIRIAVANTSLDTDIWQGLRSPAAVGRYPVGFKEIWDFYASNMVNKIRHDGSPNYLAMPESFADAQKRFSRAVIISAMLPIEPKIFRAYHESITKGDMDYANYYCRAGTEVDAILSRAIAALSLTLSGNGRAAICMDNRTATKVAEFTRSPSESGGYHGPCNDLFPQNSVAVLTGLVQFGLARVPMRDERNSQGNIVRMMGSCCSVIVFDDKPLADNCSGAVLNIDSRQLKEVKLLSDFTVTDGDIVQRRFCAYNQIDSATGGSVCGYCIKSCPSGALANSCPEPDGSYCEDIMSQKHRFHDGFLDFDHGKCSQYRSQRKDLNSEFVCGRCVAVCAAKGFSGLGRRSDG